MDLTRLNIGIGDGGERDKSKPGERLEDEGSFGSVEGAGFDTRRSFSIDDSDSEANDCFNDEGLDLPAEDADLVAKLSFDHDDKYLQQIKDSIAHKQNGEAGSVGSAGSGSNIESPQVKTSDQYMSVPYGLIPKASYEHGKRSTDIMGVTYNARMRQFIIIDSKGVTAWKRDAVDHRVTRALSYPKYEYGLITNMIYAKKYNCYFVLGKDFSLKVYNRDFFETCSVSADLRSVLFMLFNPVRDELITGGVGGTKVWKFHQQSGKTYTELKPLANYGLSLKYELPNVGGSWVKRVELDYHLEHLYCCSDTDLHVYDLNGKLLFKFERAHMMSITGCRYSRNASVLVTSSIDCEVKVWSLMGGLVHTFRGHSRAVTNLTLHPHTSSIVITCSLDGSVRMWSLDTMETLYSLVVSTDGVMWMGLTDDNQLFLSTQRAITLWNLNYSLQFWAMARSNVNKMSLVGCKGKTTRLMAILDDNSVRLMARSNNKNLCTVLPPPSLSPLQRVLSVCYSREFNVIFMLTNPHEIWVYTTRTDPSCRIAVWDVVGMQAMVSNSSSGRGNQESFDPTSISVNKPAPSHRATENGAGNEALANCCCVSILNSTAILWTDEGPCCPIRDSYLLMGLEDGRILFMDPVMKGHKYLEFKTGKDPVLDMTHDMEHGCLTTVHKLKDMMQILVWSLPDLELQHEVYAAMDLRSYARVGYTLVTGHESGCIIFNPLEITNDAGLNKGRSFPLYAEVIDIHHKPEHLAPVIGVDVCAYQKIFCTCSNDGAIKIWNEDGALMTEIMLDPSLTSVCFLNNVGDLLVGFQKQIFYIDHSKVCPQFSVPESDVDGFDKESFICEDPAVLYEGVTPNPDPITLESYLVPFDIEFSKDFLEGRVKLEPEPIKEEESDDESEASMAPTEIYFSPVSTPRSDLSQIDLTLGSEVSRYDLLKQMKKTLAHLDDRERLEEADLRHQLALDSAHRKAQARKRRRMMKQGLLKVEDFEDGVISTVEEANDDGADGRNGKPAKEKKQIHVVIPLTFEFPVFGESPGPTPESSNPPTPTSLSDSEEESQTVAAVEKKPAEVKVQVLPKEQDEISKFLEMSKPTDFSTSTKSSKPEVSSTPRKKFGLSGISVDAASLMKEKKRLPKPSALDTPRLTAPPTPKPLEEKSESPRKEKAAKKRMSLTGRKLPKSKKIEASEERLRPSTPPSSQMQALEIKEQTLAVPEKKIQSHNKPIDSSNDAAKEKLFDEKMKKKEENGMKTNENEQKKPDSIVVKMDVPSLPALPVDVGGTNSEKPQTQMDRGQVFGSASSSGVKSASVVDTKSSIDFSSLSRAAGISATSQGEITTISSPNQVVDDTNSGRARGGLGGVGGEEEGLRRVSTAATADSGIVNTIDGLSVVSDNGSEEGQATFRIELISKEVKDGQGQRASPQYKDISSADVKKGDNVSQPKKDPKVRQCQQGIASEGAMHHKKKSEAVKPNSNKNLGSKQNYNIKNRTNNKLVSGGKKKELSPLGSLQEVDDTLEQIPSSREGQAITVGAPEKPALILVTKEKETANLEQEVSVGSGISSVVNTGNTIVSADSKNSGIRLQHGKSFLKDIPGQTNFTDQEKDDKYNGNSNSKGDNHSQFDNVDNKSLLDSSYARATTPSLSVIETESVSSSTHLHRGFASSSPIPTISEGLPYLGSSPLPTVEEVSVKSWPSSIVSETPQPTAISSYPDKVKVKEAITSSPNNKIDLDPQISSEEKDTTTKSTEVGSHSNDTRRESSSQFGINDNDSLKSTSLHIAEESFESKKSSVETLGRIVEKPEPSVISAQEMKSGGSGSKNNSLSSSLSVSRKENSMDLNKRIENDHQLTSNDGKSFQSSLSEYNEKSSSSKASAHSLDIDKDASVDTTLSPVSQIIIQRKKQPEQGDRSVDAGGDNNGGVSSPEYGSDQDGELESWDSDFDNMSMSMSAGSCIMSSTFSDSSQGGGGGGGSGGADGDGSGSSGRKVNPRRRLQTTGGGNASASSSAAAEPILQIRIRKKPWSYYRNKEQQRTTPLPPRKDGGGRSDGQRKFSQSDAMTVQRNAYLEAAKLRRNRAKSAVEGGSRAAQVQPMRNSLQRQQSQPKQQMDVTTSSSTATCALCVAEEGKKHEHDSMEAELKHEPRRTSNVDSRKVSFGGDGGAEAEQKASPRVSVDAGLRQERSPRAKPTAQSSSATTELLTITGGVPTQSTTTTIGGSGSEENPSSAHAGTSNNNWKQEQKTTVSATAAAGGGGGSGFESPLPHSQAAMSQADTSSLRPIPSPTEFNQSVALTDFSQPQSHQSHEDSQSTRRPESVESGWMGSDLVSVSRMGYHSAGGALGGLAGDAEAAAAGDDDTGRRPRGGQDAEDSVKVEDLEDHKDGEGDGSSKRLTRPRTCLASETTLGKPELDDAVKFFRSRPHTANTRFQTADLQEAFDNTLERYKVMARPTLASDNLHRNDDMAFTENWHERQIERHMLIRMQKELRVQSAQQRRQVMEQRKQDKFRLHQEQDHGPTKSKFHAHLYAHSATLNPSSQQSQRCVTVHGSRPSQYPLHHQAGTPLPTPVSSRPHTSTGLRGGGDQRLHPRHQQPHQQQHVSNVHIHPASAYQQAIQQLEMQQKQEELQQQEQESLLRDRSELSQEKAFRFRLREKEGVEQAEDPLTGEKTNLDLWDIDPRNPHAVRPKSRKSIPSKCHRYVLVTKPKIKLTLPLPTPLEEELLATRFPDQGEKVYKRYEGLLYKPPKRPMYGIEYTPFHQTQTYTA